MVARTRDSIYVLAILVCIGFIYHMLFKIHETERKIMKMQADDKKRKYEEITEIEDIAILSQNSDEPESKDNEVEISLQISPQILPQISPQVSPKMLPQNPTKNPTELQNIPSVEQPTHGRYVYKPPQPPKPPQPDYSLITANTTFATRYTSEFMVFVLTRRDAFQTRQVIRETWAKGHANVLFLVGKGCPYPTSILNPKDKLSCELDETVKISDYAEVIRKKIVVQKEITVKIMKEKKEYEDDVVLLDMFDSYRSLPLKMKLAHRMVIKEFPRVKWVVKADDDMYIRVASLGKWLSKVEATHSLTPFTHPTIIGHYRTLPVLTWGKNAEFDYKPENKYYPRFPMGSFGHIVSRYISDYINTNFDALMEYQGEDTSLGIWMDQSPMKTSVKWLGCDVCVHSGQCEDKNKLLIGHHIKIKRMRECYEKDDEVEIEKLGVMEPRGRYRG